MQRVARASGSDAFQRICGGKADAAAADIIRCAPVEKPVLLCGTVEHSHVRVQRKTGRYGGAVRIAGEHDDNARRRVAVHK